MFLNKDSPVSAYSIYMKRFMRKSKNEKIGEISTAIPKNLVSIKKNKETKRQQGNKGRQKLNPSFSMKTQKKHAKSKKNKNELLLNGKIHKTQLNNINQKKLKLKKSQVSMKGYIELGDNEPPTLVQIYTPTDSLDNDTSIQEGILELSKNDPSPEGLTQLNNINQKKLKLKKSQVSMEGYIEHGDNEPPTLVPIYTPTDSSDNNTSIREGILELSKTDPSPEGLKLFKWMMAPINPATFFEKYWEVEALHIQHGSGSYYTDILTTERLDNIFREFPLYYTKNVDVVSYENGIKEVHNEEGRVIASALYDYYSNGCSIRVLNPHTYDQKVHLLIATLQEYFGTMVGANIYLTPPDSQGFAPHYDDIEAFVIQLEGRKHWKLYKPRGSDILARDSSPNLKREDIGEPFMEVTLNAGDLLYFPRGTIHEGRTDPDAHSFHVTVSVYQHNSYADLLEHALPIALKKAASENMEYREGLPLNYLKHTGHVNRKVKSKERKLVIEKVQKLLESLKDHIDVDRAADQLGRKFMYDSMPPVLSKQEVKYTSKYDGDYMKDGKICNRVEIDMDTEVRLLRYFCLRLVEEDDSPKIYYNTENAKYYHGEEEQFLTIDRSLIPCIEKLQRAYPNFLKVEDLPVGAGDDINKAQLVSDLWERGLLVTNGPLPPVSDGEDEDGEDGDFPENRVV